MRFSRKLQEIELEPSRTFLCSPRDLDFCGKTWFIAVENSIFAPEFRRNFTVAEHAQARRVRCRCSAQACVGPKAARAAAAKEVDVKRVEVPVAAAAGRADAEQVASTHECDGEDGVGHMIATAQTSRRKGASARDDVEVDAADDDAGDD